MSRSHKCLKSKIFIVTQLQIYNDNMYNNIESKVNLLQCLSHSFIRLRFHLNDIHLKGVGANNVCL